MDFLWNFLAEMGANSQQLTSLKYLYLLILMMPIVATVIGIARYIIGLRTLNFYIPLLLTFVFFEIGFVNNTSNVARGLLYGIIMFVSIFLTSTLLYSLLKRLRMHYIPKLSLIIIGVSIATLFLVTASLYFERTPLIAISPLALIFLVTTSEGFMGIYAKKNFRYTASIAFETLLISIISYLLISWDVLQNFFFQNPIAILGLIVVNFYVGRFLGLRVNEYWRFRNILLKKEESPDEQIRTSPTK